MSEHVVVRDVYTKGMEVRLRGNGSEPGPTVLIVEDIRPRLTDYPLRGHGYSWTPDGFYWNNKNPDEHDIIGEVVDTTEAQKLRAALKALTDLLQSEASRDLGKLTEALDQARAAITNRGGKE